MQQKFLRPRLNDGIVHLLNLNVCIASLIRLSILIDVLLHWARSHPVKSPLFGSLIADGTNLHNRPEAVSKINLPKTFN
jgi:hypothetical protein